MDQLASAFAAFIPGSDYVWWSWVLFSWRLLARLVSSRLFCFQEQASRKKRKQGRSRAECSDEAANIAESCHLRKQHLMF